MIANENGMVSILTEPLKKEVKISTRYIKRPLLKKYFKWTIGNKSDRRSARAFWHFDLEKEIVLNLSNPKLII